MKLTKQDIFLRHTHSIIIMILLSLWIIGTLEIGKVNPNAMIFFVFVSVVIMQFSIYPKIRDYGVKKTQELYEPERTLLNTINKWLAGIVGFLLLVAIFTEITFFMPGLLILYILMMVIPSLLAENKYHT